MRGSDSMTYSMNWTNLNEGYRFIIGNRDTIYDLYYEYLKSDKNIENIHVYCVNTGQECDITEGLMAKDIISFRNKLAGEGYV
jgi:hypothetical protein